MQMSTFQFKSHEAGAKTLLEMKAAVAYGSALACSDVKRKEIEKAML